MSSTQPNNSDPEPINSIFGLGIGISSNFETIEGSTNATPLNLDAKQPKLTFVRQKRQVPFFLEWLNEDVGIEMIQIPAGTFLMGSPEDESDRNDNESPQHEVTVQSFFMGRYPVTQAQWRVVAGYPQVNQELDPDPSRFKGETRPVETVSWYDAVEFCERLSIHTGREYRLPSEAEWEYACRAGTTTPFYFGKTLTTNIANYDGSYTYSDGSTGENREETTPVDYFCIANSFGLSDMHGNVWEWCQDHRHENYEGAPTNGSAWLTDDENAYRVCRGGTWLYAPGYCRSAFRIYDSLEYRHATYGFRVVCSAPRTS